MAIVGPLCEQIREPYPVVCFCFSLAICIGVSNFLSFLPSQVWSYISYVVRLLFVTYFATLRCVRCVGVVLEVLRPSSWTWVGVVVDWSGSFFGRSCL